MGEAGKERKLHTLPAMERRREEREIEGRWWTGWREEVKTSSNPAAEEEMWRGWGGRLLWTLGKEEREGGGKSVEEEKWN